MAVQQISTEKSAKPVQVQARRIALSAALMNVSLYFILALIILFAPAATIDKLLDHVNGIAFLIYGSSVFSFGTACLFNIASEEKRTEMSFAYALLFLFNLTSFLIYYGMSHWGEGLGML